MKSDFYSLFILIILLTVMNSCLGQQKHGNFSETEKALLDSIGFDIHEIEKVKRVIPEVVFNRYWHFDWDEKGRRKIVHDSALLFSVPTGIVNSLLESLRDSLLKGGYMIFKVDYFRGDNPKMGFRMGIIKAQTQFDLLRFMHTDAANYGRDNEWVINTIENIDERYSLRIIGAGLDYVEATFINPPTDWHAFAEEVYSICPDVVDQNAETVERLAEGLQQMNGLFLWWD